MGHKISANNACVGLLNVQICGTDIPKDNSTKDIRVQQTLETKCCIKQLLIADTSYILCKLHMTYHKSEINALIWLAVIAGDTRQELYGQ